MMAWSPCAASVASSRRVLQTAEQEDRTPLLRNIGPRLSILLVGFDSRLRLVLFVSWQELLAQLDIGRGWGKRAICRRGWLRRRAWWLGPRTDFTVTLVQPAKHGWRVTQGGKRTDRRMQVKRRCSKGNRADSLRSPLRAIKIQSNAKGEPPSTVSSLGPPYFQTVASWGRHPRF